MKHIATTSPEDYFRYVCTDDVAKEMFDQYCTAMESEIEFLSEQIDEQARDKIAMLDMKYMIWNVTLKSWKTVSDVLSKNVTSLSTS